MVPAFVQLARMEVKSAVATSLVCVGAFAIPGTITHALLGHIDWRVAIALIIGVIPGARLGAALAIRADRPPPARHRRQLPRPHRHPLRRRRARRARSDDPAPPQLGRSEP